MKRWLPILLVLGCLATAADAQAAPAASAPSAGPVLPNLETKEGVTTASQWLIYITLLSVAPAVLILVTCFTRIVVVLGLLRQALTTQNLPPNQVLFGLALLMTLLIMAPVYQQVYGEAVRPYLDGKLSRDAALETGKTAVQDFMVRQIEAAGNTDDVFIFLDEKTAAKKDLAWKDVPVLSLIPAFVVSELKVAFVMGFRIFLPFLVIDLLVSSILVSMGMLMVPPVLISLPFKLLLFILANGWHLVVGTLMKSFA